MDRSRDDFNFEEIHQIVKPADVRVNDRILARVRRRHDDSSEFAPFRVWRVSPLGVELVVTANSLELSKGEPIDLEITIAGQRSMFEGLVVDSVRESAQLKLLGVRLSKRVQQADSDSERRKAPRWLCSDEFFPICIAPSPGRINDFMRFQVRDISPDGMQLVCSLRNKFLLPNTMLKLSANFPLIGDFVASVRVVRVGFTNQHGGDKLAVGVEFLSVTEHMRRTLAQYLIQFSNADSLEDLRRNGLAPDSVISSVDFYYLKSEEDYAEVLSLRYRAHIHDRNVVDESLSESDMGDMNDTQARIVVGKRKGQIIATARVRFNTLDVPMEHESYVDWPQSLPRRDQIFEVSRVCTDPEFRKGDLLAGLFQFVSSTCIHQERPWVLIGSWPEMMGFYEKIGFVDTGLSHGEELWRSRQHLMIANSHDGMLGRTVSPVYWNIVWRVASDYIIDNSLLKPNGLDRIRLSMYKALGPFSRLAHRRLRKARPRS